MNWNTESYWRAQEGAWCGNGHFFTGATKGDGWKDYVAKFRLKLDAGSIHLNLRQTNAPGGYNRYFFGVEPSGFSVSKQTGGTFKNGLAGIKAPFPLHEWADIALVAQGNRVLMLVNGVFVIDVTDTDKPIGMGGLTLETLDSSTACVGTISSFQI